MNIMATPLAALIGVALAIIICVGASLAGFTRERGFFAIMVMVIASYYVLFAVLSGSFFVLWRETALMLAFTALAITGYKTNYWLVVIALAAHGVFDSIHNSLIVNAGVPGWWPAFCLTFDVTAAGALALGLLHAGEPKAAGNQ